MAQNNISKTANITDTILPRDAIVTKLWIAEYQAGNYVYVRMGGNERQHVTVSSFSRFSDTIKQAFGISAISLAKCSHACYIVLECSIYEPSAAGLL